MVSDARMAKLLGLDKVAKLGQMIKVGFVHWIY